MSSIPRIQLSLTFDDIEFFHNYIKPVKDNREITPLIMRLLEAYFLDTNVQRVVDSFGLEDVGTEDLIQDEFHDSISRAKDTLAMMSVLSESVKDIINIGQIDIEGMVSQADAIFEAAENAPTQEEATPQLQLNPVDEDSHRVAHLEETVKGLSNEMAELKDMFRQFMVHSGAVERPTETPITVSEDLNIFDEDVISAEPEAEQPTNTEVSLSEVPNVDNKEALVVDEEPVSVDVAEVMPRRSTSAILADIDATLGDIDDSFSRPVLKAPIEDDIEVESKTIEESAGSDSTVQEETSIDGTNSLMAFLSDF